MPEPRPLPPILTAQLFPTIEARLLELLRSLSPDDWERQTVSPQWKVKDVAAHLLDTQLRKLSLARDGYVAERPDIRSPQDLAAFINRLNQEGVRMYRRLSPAVLIDIMAVASRESTAYHQSLDPDSPAAFGVSWAGEEQSLNWFDTAREYTERWHHQQQIRLAVDKHGIMTRELYYPVLDCFMRALPHSYRGVPADSGTYLQVNVSGECGGAWFLLRRDERWELAAEPLGEKKSEVTVPQEIAWRVFTKGIDYASASAQTRIIGDRELGLHVLRTLAIVA